MRTKLVKRHYCEHCGKGGFQRPRMERHEQSCTANPNRICRMCVLFERVQKPMAELLAIVPKADLDPESRYVSNPEEDERLARVLKALRDATGDCPCCILAVSRQQGQFLPGFEFKKEFKSEMDEHNRWQNEEHRYSQ